MIGHISVNLATVMGCRKIGLVKLLSGLYRGSLLYLKCVCLLWFKWCIEAVFMLILLAFAV